MTGTQLLCALACLGLGVWQGIAPGRGGWILAGLIPTAVCGAVCLWMLVVRKR